MVRDTPRAVRALPEAFRDIVREPDDWARFLVTGRGWKGKYVLVCTAPLILLGLAHGAGSSVGWVVGPLLVAGMALAVLVAALALADSEEDRAAKPPERRITVSPAVERASAPTVRLSLSTSLSPESRTAPTDIPGPAPPARSPCRRAAPARPSYRAPGRVDEFVGE